MKGLRLISLSAVLALAGSSLAGTIFSSFGQADAYRTNLGWVVGTNSFSPFLNQRVGAQFTASGSGQLLSIEFGSYTFTNGSLNVSLYSDLNDSLGTELERFSLSAAPANSGSRILQVTSSNPSVSLVDGEKYWVFLSDADPTVRAAWAHNSIGLTGRLYSVQTDVSGSSANYIDNLTMPAFRVNVVPEPASMAALGLGALALIRKRGKKA